MNRPEHHDDIDGPTRLLLRRRQRSDGSPRDCATADPTGVRDDPADPIAPTSCCRSRAIYIRLSLRAACPRLRGIKPSRDGRRSYRKGALLGPGHELHYNYGGNCRTLKISPATAMHEESPISR